MIFTYERQLISDIFHRNHVVWKIQNDRRTSSSRNRLLGRSFHFIRFKIIQNGRVDFDQGYRDQFGELSPDDLVSLYSYLYLSRHHAEAMSTFDRFASLIDTNFHSKSQLWIVDLGCGPGTAGLAFADYSSGQLFHYLGIDRSIAMRRAARENCRLARDAGILNEKAFLTFASDKFCISTALKSCRIPINIIFVASYLFASHSLDTSWAIQAVHDAIGCKHVEKCLFVYLNSAMQFANQKYENFVGSLGSVANRIGVHDQLIRYRRYAQRKTGIAHFVNDCLILKGFP
jgi:SAM-dependent methyltransferase